MSTSMNTSQEPETQPNSWREFFSRDYQLFVRECYEGEISERRANDEEFTEYAISNGLLTGTVKGERWRSKK